MPLDSALTLSVLGYRVVPVWGKSPQAKGWNTRTWTDAAIRDEFERGADGVGLILEGLVDFDCDTPEALQAYEALGLPPTVSWASRRGPHFLFRLGPGQAVPRVLGLEVRSGSGEQSVLPPSAGRAWTRSLLEHEPANLPEVWTPDFDEPDDRLEEQTGPGATFNERASWDEILSDLGCKYVGRRSVDGREVHDWLRPGETDKQLSLTVGYCRSGKGTERMFCFTSSFAPFEQGESYSKFAAYTLTHHDGDYAAAARDLAGKGYVETLDASVFDDDEEPRGEAPSIVASEVEEESHTLLFPGFVSDVAAWHLRRSPISDARAGAVAGLMAASWMLGRRVRLYDGTRPNLTAMLLGEPGSGKSQTASTIHALLAAAGYGESVERDVVSGPALEVALSDHPNLIMIRDEVQDMLAGAERNQYTQSLISRVKEVFSASRSTFTPRRKASEKPLPPIPYPSLAVLLLGTPAATRDAISDTAYEDGFMARMLLFETDEDAPPNRTASDEAPPEELVEAVKSWQRGAVFDDGREGELPPDPREIICTAEAEERLWELRRDWQTTGTGVERHLRRRGQELTCKLCLIAAASEGMDREIDLGIVDRCIGLVDEIILHKLRDWEMRSFGYREQQRRLDRVRDYLRRKGRITWRTGLRNLHMPAPVWGETIVELFMRGEIDTDAEFTTDGTRLAKIGKYVALKGCGSGEA